jgi:excisionase family DNA binding protein
MRQANERHARRFAAEPELISLRAAAAILGDVSANTVRRLAKAGKIKCIKVGGRYMLRLDSVRAFARGEPT